MAKIDLTNYNLAELKGLHFDIEKEIKSRQQGEVRKAREQILAIAQDMGLPVSALLSSAGTGKRKTSPDAAQPGPARYRNPADAAQTWTGRGRQPKWIAQALAGGKALDDFRI